MTIGSKFNVGLKNITIDRLTLLSYKIKLDNYIKKNNLWEENVIECWLYDLCDYALKLLLFYKLVPHLVLVHNRKGRIANIL